MFFFLVNIELEVVVAFDNSHYRGYTLVAGYVRHQANSWLVKQHFSRVVGSTLPLNYWLPSAVVIISQGGLLRPRKVDANPASVSHPLTSTSCHEDTRDSWNSVVPG